MASRHFRIRDRFVHLLVGLVTVLIFLPAVPAAAAVTHTVACPGDSIQAAIDAAHPGDTILVEGTCQENIVIDKNLEIDGQWTSTIDGGGRGSGVVVEPGVTVVIGRLIIEDGAAEFGAGILNNGDLTLNEVQVRANGVDRSVVRTHRGAGIFNSEGANLRMTGGEISGNVAWWAAGGLYNRGLATIDDVDVRANAATASHNHDFSDPNAGGIVNTRTLNIYSSLFEGNVGRNVGAIDNRPSGAINVQDTTFLNHGAHCSGGAIEGGAVRNSGAAFFANSSFSFNHAGETGGAIANFGTLDIASAVFTDNSTCDAGGIGGGGALYNNGRAVLGDVLFDSNRAPDDNGGAVFNEGSMQIHNSSFIANSSERGGGAIANGVQFGTSYSTPPELTLGAVDFVENAGGEVGALSSDGLLEATGLDIDFSIGPRTIRVGGIAYITDSGIQLSQASFGETELTGIAVTTGRLHLHDVHMEFVGNPAVRVELEIEGDDEAAFVHAEIDGSDFVGGGIFVGPGGGLEMGRSLISQSSVSGDGGALHLAPDAYADLYSVELTDNSAERGGAVYMAPGVRVFASDLTATGNSATHGGAVFIDGGSNTEMEVFNSTFTGNSAVVSGGAFAVDAGGLSAWDIVVDSNSAGWNGGGIHSKGGGVQLESSKVNSNTARSGGGIASVQESGLGLVDSIVSGNRASEYGGGIFNVASYFTAYRSAIMNNRSDLGAGGIENRRGAENAETHLINSTVARNMGVAGSAVRNLDALMSLDHVTITENTGSPAVVEDKSPPWTTFINSIVAGNPDGDCFSDHHSGGGNVVGDCTFRDPTTFDPVLAPTDIDGVSDPLLVPTPAQPGQGATLFIPDPGSPAVDRVPFDDCVWSEDQRLLIRPQGTGCEAGSVEIESATDVIAPVIYARLAHGDLFPSGVVTFMGNSFDNVGVVWIGIAVQDLNTGLWLQDDEVSWGTFNRIPAVMLTPGAHWVGWRLPIAIPDGRYVLSALARDAAGNEGRIVPWRLFTVGNDSTAPTIDANFAHGDVFDSPVPLAGIAEDDTGVVWVGLGVQDLATKLWLQDDMTSWDSFDRFPADLVDSGGTTTDWSLDIELPAGRYVLSALARDQAGNEGRIVPWRLFIVEGGVAARQMKGMLAQGGSSQL